MQIMYERCAGLDVHKRTVVACRVRPTEVGTVERVVRTCGTTTNDLLRLLDWLQAWACTHVAIESTGEYWKPVFNILESALTVILVNAQHVKAVPGRTPDVKDSEWLADLLRHGLLRPSFIPPLPQRELRDLTRQRTNLAQDRARVVNQMQKVLEQANLKLAAVVSDVMGVSGRAMLDAIAAGEDDVSILTEMARGSLRNKREALTQALTGRITDHHRFLLLQHLQHIDFLNDQIAAFETEIDHHIDAQSPDASPAPSDAVATGAAASVPISVTYRRAITLLDTIPGVNERVAESMVAELGTDMTRFPSSRHLAAWAGLAPTNNESAGKQRSGRISAGDRPLRHALVQAANAAARTKETYIAGFYHRLAARRGKKRALIAVAHTMLVSAYSMLTRNEEYSDLGYTYLDQRKREAAATRLSNRLKHLGYAVQLHPLSDTPSPKPALSRRGFSQQSQDLYNRGLMCNKDSFLQGYMHGSTPNK